MTSLNEGIVDAKAVLEDGAPNFVKAGTIPVSFVWDRPVAKPGSVSKVFPGDTLSIQGTGSDRFGSIVKWE